MITAAHIAGAVLDLAEKRRLSATELTRLHDQAKVAGPLLADWALADNLDFGAVMEAVKSWHRAQLANRGAITCTIGSPNGRGKSVAAARWLSRNRGVFLRATALSRESWTGGQLVADARVADHLVIDNLGSERGRAREHIVGLIIERHDDGLPTLITTTLAFGAPADKVPCLSTEYPQSVCSRLATGCDWIEGKDMRVDPSHVPDLTSLLRARELLQEIILLSADLHAGDSAIWERLVGERQPGSRPTLPIMLGIADAFNGRALTQTESGKRVREGAEAIAERVAWLDQLDVDWTGAS